MSVRQTVSSKLAEVRDQALSVLDTGLGRGAAETVYRDIAHDLLPVFPSNVRPEVAYHQKKRSLAYSEALQVHPQAVHAIRSTLLAALGAASTDKAARLGPECGFSAGSVRHPERPGGDGQHSGRPERARVERLDSARRGAARPPLA